VEDHTDVEKLLAGTWILLLLILMVKGIPQSMCGICWLQIVVITTYIMGRREYMLTTEKIMPYNFFKFKHWETFLAVCYIILLNSTLTWKSENGEKRVNLTYTIVSSPFL
jgi:hypothetical protein